METEPPDGCSCFRWGTLEGHPLDFTGLPSPLLIGLLFLESGTTVLMQHKTCLLIDLIINRAILEYLFKGHMIVVSLSHLHRHIQIVTTFISKYFIRKMI